MLPRSGLAPCTLLSAVRELTRFSMVPGGRLRAVASLALAATLLAAFGAGQAHADDDPGAPPDMEAHGTAPQWIAVNWWPSDPDPNGYLVYRADLAEPFM